MNLLIAGGLGFIGTNLCLYLNKKYPNYNLFVLDKQTYAANLKSPAHINLYRGDIAEINHSVYPFPIDGIINLAAETHVDNSIKDSYLFVKTNVLGTQNLLELARKKNCRYLQVSTDECYGSLGPTGYFTEETPLAPNSPYAASKASADLLVRSYYQTYGLDTVITRCSNNFGPYQHKEKLIPMVISKALKNEKIPLYGDGKNIRDWLYVEDHCRAIDLVFHKGKTGEIYNVGGRNEFSNADLIKAILIYLGKDLSLIEHVEDRLGHDRRYAIDPFKIETELRWSTESPFWSDLYYRTIDWYIKNAM